MGQVSSIASTWCGPPPGLVGSQRMGESQIRGSSDGIGADHHAQSLMTIDENCPSRSISRPSSRRQAPVESEPMPEIRSSVPAVNSGVLVNTFVKIPRVAWSWHERLRWFQSQPAGKEEDREISDENGLLLVPKPSKVVSGRRHLLLLLGDHLMCPDGRSEESLLKRRAAMTIPARQNLQTAFGKFFKFVQKRTHLQIEDVEIETALVAYSNDCFVHGVNITMIHSFLLQ